MSGKTSPLEPRLLAKLVKSDDPDGCWIFQGSRDHQGYGQIRDKGHLLYAHRAAFVLWVGPVPPGFNVCHHCDTPLCCRPAHLFTGSQADNIADMQRKGRHKFNCAPRGERQGHAYLTAEQVLEIRRRYVKDYGNQRALAQEFGTTGANIYRIVHGDNWRHLKPVA